MEDYPQDYTEHNLPLILISGLGTSASSLKSARGPHGQESGSRLALSSRQCLQGRAEPVLGQVLQFDGTQQSWTTAASAAPLRYKIRTIDRTYTLPPRKAAPLPQSPGEDPLSSKQGGNELHSPLSPLSPGSPVFPDGIMCPAWFAKHQSQVPALFLIFFDITSDGGSSQDSVTKADINGFKAALSRSGFRSRFAVVLMSDRSILQAPELDERITSIRRATSLDSKNGLFFMPPMATSEEITVFVANMLTTLRPVCFEHYRELTKHARRKKTRSSVPSTPSTPTLAASQVLSPSGWNVRYEVKQGVFAEFRQEVETAERHYAQAIQELCDEGGIFDMAAGWSQRWDEARLLCDILAMRMVRCLLRTGATTNAAKSWYEYRDRMRIILERKGKGTKTYSWAAWECRWALVMAQLIQSAELPAFDTSLGLKHERSSGTDHLLTHAAAEKSMQSFERVPSVHLLHHAGYWYRLALAYARTRLVSALEIPAEDHAPPAESPASSVARRAETYDTYLVPEPHEEYEDTQRSDRATLARLTEAAVLHYTEREQRRMSDELTLALADDLVHIEQYQRAFEILVPIWDATSWRSEEWQDLFARLLQVLHQCAQAALNAEIALATTWELFSVSKTIGQGGPSAIQLLEALTVPDGRKVALGFQNNERRSPISYFFAFDGGDAHAGEPVRCQLGIEHNGSSEVGPLTISQMQLVVSSQPVITLVNDSSSVSTDAKLTIIQLDRTDRGLTAALDLQLRPSQVHIIEFCLTFREAETVRLERLTSSVAGDKFLIVQEINEPILLRTSMSFHHSANGIVSRELRCDDSTMIEVLPKQPKVELEVVDLKAQYLVGEVPSVCVRVLNQESKLITASVDVEITDGASVLEGLATIDYVSTQTTQEPASALVGISVSSGSAIELVMRLTPPTQPTQLSASFTIKYEIEGEPGTIQSKTIELPMSFIKMLDLKWIFEPLLYPGDWPSHFQVGTYDADPLPSGVPHRWSASLRAHSLVTEAILVKKISLLLANEPRDAVCTIGCDSGAKEQSLPSDKSLVRSFELITQKMSADDRRPLSLDLKCLIEWSYKDASETHALTVSVPRVSLPLSEPRVLCTIEQSHKQNANAVLNYHLENLSNHFLTFALTMEPSEDFAYCGVKSRMLSLTPFSRVKLAYGIILQDKISVPASKGRYISPNLQVVDSYYHKTLHILPAGPGVKRDANDSISVWIEGT